MPKKKPAKPTAAKPPRGRDRKGWSAPLIALCRKLVDAYKAGWPPELKPPGPIIMPLEGARAASVNHRAQSHGSALAYAAMYGTPEEYRAARATVLAWLEIERKQGMWRHEQLAAGSHAAQWLNAWVMVSIALDVATQRFGGDAALRDAINERWRGLWALCDAIGTPGGGVSGPGARQEKGPALEPLAVLQRERVNAANWERDFKAGGPATGKLTRPLNHKGALGRKPKPGKPDPWLTDYYTFADGFRSLLARDVVPLNAADRLPKLKHRMTVYRGKGWHYAEVSVPANGKGWVAWVYVDHRAHDKGAKPLTGVRWDGDGRDAPAVASIVTETLVTP